jgi:hypothetical protein
VADVRTTLLGQFTDDHAEVIAERLHGAGIVFWVKVSGRFTRVLFAGDWGVRIFVDEARSEEAVAIAREVTDG